MQLTTTDLYESSFLHYSGAKLARAWVDRGRRRETVVFLFEGNGQLSQLQTTYHTGQAVVNLTDYRASLEELRAQMFELLRGSRRPTHTHSQNKTKNPEGSVRYDSRKQHQKAIGY